MSNIPTISLWLVTQTTLSLFERWCLFLVIFRKWLVRVIDINTRGGVAPEWVYVNYEYKPFSKYFVS